jgi:hypothetical protein
VFDDDDDDDDDNNNNNNNNNNNIIIMTTTKVKLSFRSEKVKYMHLQRIQKIILVRIIMHQDVNKLNYRKYIINDQSQRAYV